MPPVESRLRIREESDATIVEFVDRNILDEANIKQIGDEIGAVIDGSPAPKIVISFTNVEHLSSAALGTLITVNNRVRGKGGQLRLASIRPEIHEVFEITRLTRLFEIHDDIEAALASLD